jgi:LysR family hydrogen peroxide-inducible transcriptional activator
MFAPSRRQAISAAAPTVARSPEDLGAKLFDRLGRSVRLTEAGRVFIPHARAILEQMDVARLSVADKNADLRGNVSAGVIPTIAPYLMPRHTAAFAKKYPDAKLRIIWIFPFSHARGQSSTARKNQQAISADLKHLDRDIDGLKKQQFISYDPNYEQRRTSRNAQVEELSKEVFLREADGQEVQWRTPFLENCTG